MTLERRSISVAGGVTLSYLAGGPHDGCTVLLCHGLGAGARQFAADASAFADRGFRVLVPDLPGHGMSRLPAGSIDYPRFTVAALSADLFALLDAERVARVDWLGNSLGGIVALAMVDSDRRRFRSLATFGTAYRLNLPSAGVGLIPGLYRIFGKRLLSATTAWATSRDPEARKLIASVLMEADPRAIAAIIRAVARYDHIAYGIAYDGPILMLRGRSDGAVNRALGPTLAAMSGRPNFTLVDIPGGHCANLDAPDIFRAELLKFWDRV